MKLLVKDLSAKRANTRKKWPMAKRVEVVSQYLALGNMSLVADLTGVDHHLIRKWKMAPWWKEMEDQIRSTETQQTDRKLTTIIDKSLDAVLDRVENGEFFYDSKSGTVKRRPASLRDVTRVSTDMLTKRDLLRGNQTERKEVAQLSVAEQLKNLAMEFAKWQMSEKKREAIDVETIEVIEKEADDAVHEEEKN